MVSYPNVLGKPHFGEASFRFSGSYAYFVCSLVYALANTLVATQYDSEELIRDQTRFYYTLY